MAERRLVRRSSPGRLLGLTPVVLLISGFRGASRKGKIKWRPWKRGGMIALKYEKSFLVQIMLSYGNIISGE